MRMPIVSRILFCFVSAYLVVGAHIADYSRAHLFRSPLAAPCEVP
jgi:hypothetical protein